MMFGSSGSLLIVTFISYRQKLMLCPDDLPDFSLQIVPTSTLLALPR